MFLNRQKYPWINRHKWFHRAFLTSLIHSVRFKSILGFFDQFFSVKKPTSSSIGKLITSEMFWFIFFFFWNPSLLSFEAWPHVGLYIHLCYPLASSASFTSISVAVLSFRAGLTPSDHALVHYLSSLEKLSPPHFQTVMMHGFPFLAM